MLEKRIIFVKSNPKMSKYMSIFLSRRPAVVVLLVMCCEAVCGQSYPFGEDALQRGWYSRPYTRYEAEVNQCRSNGVFLPLSEDQRTLQSEATHQQAVQLLNAGEYVEWTTGSSGKGLTIRFSLPDSSEGTGTEGSFVVRNTDGNRELFAQSFTLSSYHAWQYTASGANYPDNTPGAGKLTRMKFDETHFLLQAEVTAGSTIRIERADNSDKAYTIDFIELEPVPEPKTAADIAALGVVRVYNPSSDGDVGSFINNNGGQTLFIPAGRYETDKRIYLNTEGTKVIGAGEWYTEIFFTASSDNGSTYSHRGFEGSRNNLLVEGLYLNTVNNKRYYQNNDSKQVGKGFQGGFGTGSVIRHCWVEHFECGAWIADYSGNNSRQLTVEYCRFRNNYADGINLCKGSTAHVVRYCSFRNNGDDDMASWSTGNLCSGNVFEYCTAENNWRASSLGFFGGQNQTAHHIAVYDALESGVRATCDFAGTGFKTTGRILLHDISIVHCGCPSGTRGTAGDFWGNMAGAMALTATANYDLNNVEIYDIDIVDSRTHAVWLRGANGRKINNLVLERVSVSGAAGYGVYYSGAQGTARYCMLSFENCSSGEQSAHMPTFVITEQCSGDDLKVVGQGVETFSAIAVNGGVVVSCVDMCPISVFDPAGRKQGEYMCGANTFIPLDSGVYMIRTGSGQTLKTIAF